MAGDGERGGETTSSADGKVTSSSVKGTRIRMRILRWMVLEVVFPKQQIATVKGYRSL